MSSNVIKFYTKDICYHQNQRILLKLKFKKYFSYSFLHIKGRNGKVHFLFYSIIIIKIFTLFAFKFYGGRKIFILTKKLEIHFEPPGLKNWHFAKLEIIIQIELLQFLNTVLSGLKESCVRNILSTKG